MPQLPNIPGAVWGVGPTTKTDGAGVLFLSAFANDAQRVYKLVGGAWQDVPLEHTPTARGEIDIDTDGRAYLTAWDDKAVGGPWRIPIPGFVPAQAQASPLTEPQRRALAWLIYLLGPLLPK